MPVGNTTLSTVPLRSPGSIGVKLFELLPSTAGDDGHFDHTEKGI